MERTSAQPLPDLLFEFLRTVKQELSRDADDMPSWLNLETLRFIGEGKDPAMHDLASYLRVKAPTATALVAGLVKDGFVLRAEDKSDRRRVTLRLTPKGRTCLKEAKRRRDKALASLLGRLTEKDSAEFARLITRITHP